MSIGLQLALIAAVFWIALGIGGERAPSLIWAIPWIVIGITGLLLQHLAYWATGSELE